MNKKIKNNIKEQKNIDIKLLSPQMVLFSNPLVLMAAFKGGKRAEAAQWSIEIQKMLKGLVKSILALENILNLHASGKKLYLEKAEVQYDPDDEEFLITYTIDNAILRIYACLDKIAQMVRCYLEHPDNGGKLLLISRCTCHDTEMGIKECTFGSLLKYLQKYPGGRNSVVVDALKELNRNKFINIFQQRRNEFSHRIHSEDNTMGLTTSVAVEHKGKLVETTYSFMVKEKHPNIYRVELAEANNAIVKCLSTIFPIIFPPIENLVLTKDDENKPSKT